MEETTKAGSGQYEQINNSFIVLSNQGIKALGQQADKFKLSRSSMSVLLHMISNAVRNDGYIAYAPGAKQKHQVELKRGQYAHSLSKIAKEIGFTLNRVRHALRALENAGLIVKEQVSEDDNAVIYTVTNYATYVHTGMSADQHSYNEGMSADQHTGMSADQHTGMSADQHTGMSADQHTGMSADQHDNSKINNRISTLRTNNKKETVAEALPGPEASSSSGSSTAVAATGKEGGEGNSSGQTVSERKKDKIRANALIDDAIAANVKDTFNECTAVEPNNGKLFDVEFKPVKEIDKLKDAVEKLLGREILRQENETIDRNYSQRWKGKLKDDESLAKCAEAVCKAFNSKTPYTIAELLERVGETYDIKGDILNIAKSKYVYVGNNGFKYKDGRKSDLESLCDWICKSAEERHIKKKDQFGIPGCKSVENENIIEL